MQWVKICSSCRLRHCYYYITFPITYRSLFSPWTKPATKSPQNDNGNDDLTAITWATENWSQVEDFLISGWAFLSQQQQQHHHPPDHTRAELVAILLSAWAKNFSLSHRRVVNVVCVLGLGRPHNAIWWHMASEICWGLLSGGALPTETNSRQCW